MLSPQTQEYILAHQNDDVRKLALQTKFNEKVNLKMALQQIEGKQLAQKKLPNWGNHPDLIFPPRLALEQCSSEQTAAYKVQLMKDLLSKTLPQRQPQLFVDLTGGFGIDFSFLAPIFQEAIYIERQEELCCLARYNFPKLGLNHVTFICGESCAHLDKIPQADFIFIDPARRDCNGKKTVAIADCEPNLEVLQSQLQHKSPFTLIKLSPMLDIHQALLTLNGVSQVHIVSVEGECKELLFVLEKEMQKVLFFCVNLCTNHATQSFSFSIEEEINARCNFADKPELYLYEPNASILKAAAYRVIAQHYKLKKLHPNSHLYTSEKLVDSFPGRVFKIDSYCGFSKKDLKKLLTETKQANLTIRNFPDTVAGLRQRLKLAEGGDIYLFATTISNNSKILIKCSRLSSTEKY